MARWWRIDAPVDDGDASADEAVGVECSSGKRPDLSRTQGFRGEGAGQHHRALSTLEIFVVMGVGEFSGGGLRRVVVQSGLVVRHAGVGRLRDRRYARRAPARGNLGPREGQEREEGEEAMHGGRWPGGPGGEVGAAGVEKTRGGVCVSDTTRWNRERVPGKEGRLMRQLRGGRGGKSSGSVRELLEGWFARGSGRPSKRLRKRR